MKDHTSNPQPAMENGASEPSQGFPCTRGLNESEPRRDSYAPTCRPEKEDIDRGRIENRLRASNTLLQLLGSTDSRKEYLDAVIGHLIDWTG
ncbi:MAG: hypothetical protein ACLGPL_02325, partial [Acidobacteriota bacterium]